MPSNSNSDIRHDSAADENGHAGKASSGVKSSDGEVSPSAARFGASGASVLQLDRETDSAADSREGWPCGAVSEETPGHPLEVRAWRMANGSRFVELTDGTEATWQRYCAELAARSRERIAAAMKARRFAL